MIDYSKYKRVFAFGCSFTRWHHPTWANIISKCCPDAKFYNLGEGGAGNLFISSRIMQANMKFNFTDTDLVLVMFSTAFREDRWIDGHWRLYGNLYNQPFYDKKFVHEYTDPVGLIIRDIAIVETAMSYVESLPCDNIMLRAAELDSNEFFLKDEIRDRYHERIAQLYNSSKVSKLPPALNKPGKFFVRHKEYIDDKGKAYSDQHPWTSDYLNYLQECNIPLTDRAIQYANDANDIIKNTTMLEDLYTQFSYCISSINDEYEIF